ncbi:MAG: flagellar hook-length control protein FliK [Pseudomonadota bacterium]
MISVFLPEAPAPANAPQGPSSRAEPAADADSETPGERFADFLPQDAETPAKEPTPRQVDLDGARVQSAEIEADVPLDPKATQAPTDSAEADAKVALTTGTQAIAETAISAAETVADAKRLAPSAVPAAPANAAAAVETKPTLPAESALPATDRLAAAPATPVATDVEPAARQQAQTEAALTPLSAPPQPKTIAANDAALAHTKPNPATDEALVPAAPRAEIKAPAPETADVRSTESVEVKIQSIADAPPAGEKLIIAPAGRELVTSAIPDGLLPAAQTTSSNPLSTAATPGLTPTAPAQVIAAPNELTHVILNALKSGFDPQEQLVVQLDPPELGRVLIDFKFDAQGLQQVVVTSENPEALKRLRELHFELTEALKDQGLSEKNMSFRQEADDRQSSGWRGADFTPAMSSVYGQIDDAATLSAPPPVTRAGSTDRLDLRL